MKIPPSLPIRHTIPSLPFHIVLGILVFACSNIREMHPCKREVRFRNSQSSAPSSFLFNCCWLVGWLADSCLRSFCSDLTSGWRLKTPVPKLYDAVPNKGKAMDSWNPTEQKDADMERKRESKSARRSCHVRDSSSPHWQANNQQHYELSPFRSSG